MNKKLIALAIAGAFAAPVAMADDSAVVITGQIHMSVDSMNNGGSDTATKNARSTYIGSNASNISFKGTEDLGNGLSAFWQLQTYVGFGGTGNTDTTFGAAGGTLGDGNSFAGLSSKAAGAVQLGKFDYPVKVVGRKLDLFSNQIGDTRNLISGAGGAETCATTNTKGCGSGIGFDQRPNNSIQYSTPSFSGFQAQLAWRAPEGTAGTAKASMAGLGATYTNGPLFVGAGWESHDVGLASKTPSAAVGKEKDWRLGAGYAFGPAKIVALYDRKIDLGGTSGNNRTSWSLGGAYNITSNNVIKAQYTKAGDTGSVADTGASMYSIGFDHLLSKRTTVYAAYSTTNNKTNSMYSAYKGGHDDGGLGTVLNKDPSALSVGMIHNF